MSYTSPKTYLSLIEVLAIRRKRLIRAREFLDFVTPAARRQGRSRLADHCGFDSGSIKSAIFQTELRMASCEPRTWQEALLLCEVLEAWVEPGTSLRLVQSIARGIGTLGWRLTRMQEKIIRE
jgi:hypothetical protein